VGGLEDGVEVPLRRDLGVAFGRADGSARGDLNLARAAAASMSEPLLDSGLCIVKL